MRNVGLYQPSQLILSRNPWQKGGLAGAQSDKAAVALTESCCSWGSNESGPLKPWQLRPTHPFPLPHVIFLPDDLLRVDVLLPRLRPAHHFIAARGCISDYLWVAERGGSSVSWPNPRGQPRPLGPSFLGGWCWSKSSKWFENQLTWQHFPLRDAATCYHYTLQVDFPIILQIYLHWRPSSSNKVTLNVLHVIAAFLMYLSQSSSVFILILRGLCLNHYCNNILTAPKEITLVKLSMETLEFSILKNL